MNQVLGLDSYSSHGAWLGKVAEVVISDVPSTRDSECSFLLSKSNNAHTTWD